MKKIFLICIFIVLSNYAYGQQRVKRGAYIESNDLKQFEGTWLATQKGDTLLVVFQKHKVYFKQVDAFKDLILGWHKYVHQGVVIENDLHNIGASSLKKSTITGNNDNNTKKMILLFKDSKRDVSLNGTFKLVGKRSKKAILKLHYGERIMVKYGNKKNEYKEKEGPKIPVPSTWHMKCIKK